MMGMCMDVGCVCSVSFQGFGVPGTEFVWCLRHRIFGTIPIPVSVRMG